MCGLRTRSEPPVVRAGLEAPHPPLGLAYFQSKACRFKLSADDVDGNVGPEVKVLKILMAEISPVVLLDEQDERLNGLILRPGTESRRHAVTSAPGTAGSSRATGRFLADDFHVAELVELRVYLADHELDSVLRLEEQDPDAKIFFAVWRLQRFIDEFVQ